MKILVRTNKKFFKQIKFFYFLIFLVLLILFQSIIFALPAPRIPIILKQPNGIEFKAMRGGDEWFNWISHENYLIIKGNDGYWYYSNIERGILVPNQARVGIELPPFRSASINDLRKVKKSYERLFKGGCPLYEERMK